MSSRLSSLLNGSQQRMALPSMNASTTASGSSTPPDIEEFDLSALDHQQQHRQEKPISLDSDTDGDIQCINGTKSHQEMQSAEGANHHAPEAIPSSSSHVASVPEQQAAPFSAESASTPHSHNGSQASCEEDRTRPRRVPQKRKAAPVSIELSDEEDDAGQQPQQQSASEPSTATSATAQAKQEQDGQDSDLEITHHASPNKRPNTVSQGTSSSGTADVMIDNSPLLMGQITSVGLILNSLPELCGKPADGGTVPLPPLPIVLQKDDPRYARPGSDSHHSVRLATIQGTKFGCLDTRMATVLGPVMDGAPCKAHHVRFQATIVRQIPSGPCTAIFPLHILVFSTPQFYKAMSDHLANNSVWLDDPTAPYQGPERYNNPHNPQVRLAMLHAEQRRQYMQNRTRPLPGGSSSSALPQGAPSMGFRSMNTQQMSETAKREQVEAVFATMNSGADLETVEPNTALIKSSLYEHQKQALAFLIDRESLKSMPDPRRPKSENQTDEYVGLWKLERTEPSKWLNVVTGVWVPFSSFRPVMPPQCRGAILADDMGLGKTIVIISLIAHTRKLAQAFQDAGDDAEALGEADASKHGFDTIKAHPVSRQRETNSMYPPLPGSSTTKKKDKGPGKRELAREEADERRKKRLTRRSRATLIICPLSTVQNWEQQVLEHSVEKSTNVYVYHGSGRTSSPAALANHDIVITTYSTLAAEYSKMVRSEEPEKEGSSDADGGESEVEVVGSFGGIGLPMQQQQTSSSQTKEKPKKQPKKKAKAGDGTIYTSPLQQIEWFRVVLDEAHMIKEHSTIQAKAACDLSAERRVALTGTPLQNSLNDLFSLCRFIRLEPFTDRHIWTHYIGAPAKSGDQLAVSRLQLLTRHIALRRTKDSQSKEGKPILTLPPKKDEIVYLELDEQEKAFYSSHHHRYKADFLKNAQSDSLLLKNYASILQELLRLRQICCHLALVRDSQDVSNADEDIAEHIKTLGISKPRATRLLNVYRDSGAVMCCECSYEFANKGAEEAEGGAEAEVNNAAKKGKKKQNSSKCSTPAPADMQYGSLVMTRCGHVFCFACFNKSVSSNFPCCEATERASCSQCKTDLTPAVDVAHFGRNETYNDLTASESEGASKPHAIEHSTKIRALMQDLFPFSQANPASANYVPGFGVSELEHDPCSAEHVDRPRQNDSVKSVVFSQWTKLLDRVADGLDECNIRYGRLDGSMHRDARTRAMDSFRVDPTCEVLLVSLRAGGIGLNLTMASRVYLMEPFWNPAVENQATDRIHRLGQQKSVKLTRYIVKDSIEANMMEIQKRKMELANLSMSQTLPKQELAARRIENLKILFG